MRLIAIGVICVLATTAHADRKREVAEAEPAPATDQVVVVNAAPKIGDIGQISRLRRVLVSRGLLFKLPEQLEATLDGRNVLIADLDAIKDAYANVDYQTALEIIQTDEKRILEGAANGDPVPALAELCQWRGIIAAALNEQDEAVRQFRAAYRFNPAWSIDKRLASPRVRAMVMKAHHEPAETGALFVDSDPDDATVKIDDGEPHAAGSKVRLPIGIHLVMIAAPEHAPYAELVEIQHARTFRIAIALDKETTVVRAARLVDETAAAPAGKARLKRARALSRLTGATRLLFVEEGANDHVSVRLYDINLKKVSRSLELDSSAPSAAIAREIKAALDPDNLVDASTINIQLHGAPAPSHWYNHWYVWAGAALLVGGGALSYEMLTREPTAVRGFQ